VSRYLVAMKTSILLLAATVLIAPLAAQNEGPGNDLIELFEKSQREGASDEELMRLLEDKALLNLTIPDFKDLDPEAKKQRDFLEEQFQKDMEQRGFRPLMENPGFMKPGREKDKGTAGRNKPKPIPDKPHAPPRWLVGLVVKPLDPSLRSHFDLPDGAGVVVESVMPGSPAAKAGIKTNDLIVTANELKVSSLEELRAAVEKAGNEGKSMKLEVIHRGKRSTVEVKPRGPQPLEDKGSKAAPGPELRPMIEVQRRLDQQQKEIEKLRREVERLRESLKRE
jgi:PDZ domain